MGPDPRSQIRWGIGACITALLIVALLVFVPDPLFRYRTLTTTLDDVAGVQPGTKIFFRGASVGEVRAVELDPETRAFAVRLSVLKAWRPSACSYVTVAASNPFTAPRIDLAALAVTGPAGTPPAGQCLQAMASHGCDPVSPVAGDQPGMITGCRRSPDLIQTATLAVTEAAEVANTANQMAQRLQVMLQGDGSSGGKSVDMATVARNATETLAALNSLSVQLDRSFTPGKGDIALTLGNVRQLTGRAAKLDIASANGLLRETNTLVAKNQASIAALLANGAGTTAQARDMLEGASASLVQTSANLARASANLNGLTERVAADPTFVIRGQRYADPPAPGARK